jgi:hypothetical protein
VAAIVIWTKFAEGAWMVIVAIPTLIATFYGIRRHYRGVARRLRAGAAAVVAAPPPTNTQLLLVESIDEATAKALWFTRSIAGDRFRAVHVPQRRTDPSIKARWFRFTDERSQLQILDTALGRRDAVLDQVWRLPRGESSFVTVVIPELFRRRSLVAQARRPLEFLLKLRLVTEPGVAIADVTAVAGEPEPLPDAALVRVLVSGVNAASMRAVNYARTLGIPDTRAVHFTLNADDADEVHREWEEEGPGIPLEIDDAPHRDLGPPLRAYLRELTADGTQAIVVMPELIVHGWRRLLHNQRALYIKRLLLFETHVILVSVPYQLLR